jgi:hypothetical protein
MNTDRHFARRIGERADARPAGGRGPRVRPVAVTVLLCLVVCLLVAAEAQAYVPGQLIYAKRIGTSASPAGALDVAAGPNGVTAIAGWRDIAPTGRVPVVTRCTAGGATWTRAYLMHGSAEAVAIARNGNVFVAATLEVGLHGDDIALLKFDSKGNFKWATTPYDGGTNGSDTAKELAIDPDGNLIVAGNSTVGDKEGLVVLKYDANGQPLWTGRYDPPADDANAGPDYVNDLAINSAGDVYVAGESHYMVGDVWIDSGLVVKFSRDTGMPSAHWDYDAINGPSSYFESLAVRSTTVVAVGSVWNPSIDGNEHALIVPFDLSLHPPIAREWGVGDATEEWFGDVVFDSKGNIYVTGDQWLSGSGGYDKALTIKWRRGLGGIVWKKPYLPSSRDAEGWYIARDSLDNVYVAGVKGTGAYEDFLIMKYNATGTRKWLKTWSAGGPGDDEPSGMVLGTKGGVYVGGEVTAKGNFSQAALLKYQR